MQTALTENQKITFINILGKTLGVFWLLDGLLQLQPKMFTAEFVNNVLAPNLSNQPALLHALVLFGIRILSLNIPVANSLAAVLQIIIGILLLLPVSSKQFRAGLYLSIIWGLIVWMFGEGLGNLFTGAASFYTGAPGAALLYALMAGYLLMPQKITAALFTKTAAILLLAGAALQLQTMFWNSGGTQMVFGLSAADQLGAVSALPTVLLGSLSAHPILVNWLLIIVPLLFAILLFLKPGRTTGIIVIIFLFLVWWLGQDFGGLSTVWLGTATDVNAAPLIALFVLPLILIHRPNSKEQ